jgi:hypothetical protein
MIVRISMIVSLTELLMDAGDSVGVFSEKYFYLAVGLFGGTVMKLYLTMFLSLWPDGRFFSLRSLGSCYLELNQP